MRFYSDGELPEAQDPQPSGASRAGQDAHPARCWFLLSVSSQSSTADGEKNNPLLSHGGRNSAVTAAAKRQMMEAFRFMHDTKKRMKNNICT